MTGNTTNETQSSAEYQAAYDYVNGYVTSLAKAQDKFCEPVEDKFKATQNAEDVEGMLWKAWADVVEIAKVTSHDTQHRQKLVEFVLALRQRSKLRKGDQVCQVWDATVWSDLPVFGAQIRECWNAAASDSSSADQQHQWLNINAFIASLVSSAHNHGDQPDFTLFAVWALRQAFEEDKPSKIAVEAAATWLICAAPALHDLSKSGKSFDGKLARAGSAYSDKQWSGLNVERWQAWLSKLNAADASSFGARGEDLVKKAKQKTKEDLLEDTDRQTISPRTQQSGRAHPLSVRQFKAG